MNSCTFMNMSNPVVLSEALEATQATKAQGAGQGGVRAVSAFELAGRMGVNGECAIIDVRTPGEYSAEHVPGSHLLPLDEVDAAAIGRLGLGGGGEFYILCQTGGRARRAAEKLRASGVAGCVVVEGGVEACRAAGVGIVKGESRVLPLMRQVQIVIGLVSATGAGLAILRHPMFALIPLFMGLGLLFAGLSGTCGLAILMAKMPWNRRGAGSGAGVTSCGVDAGGCK